MSSSQNAPLLPKEDGKDPEVAPFGDAQRPMAVFTALLQTVQWLEVVGAPEGVVSELDEWVMDLDAFSGGLEEGDWQVVDVLMREGACIHDALQIAKKLRRLG